jgi:hypothetical protein
MSEFYGRPAVNPTGTCSYCEEPCTEAFDVRACDTFPVSMPAEFHYDVLVESCVCERCLEIIKERKYEEAAR